jgi:DNA-binding transcriptional ArsR family regulator
MSEQGARGREDEPVDEDAFDRVLKALGHRTRRRIVDLLRDGPRTTGEVCAAFPELDRCTTMQHLGVLERAGIVVARREGRERWNHLDVLPIRAVHDRWIAPYATGALGVLARLGEDLGR